MGMFDTLHVGCPACGKDQEIQTKAGRCELRDYGLHDAPPAILGDVANSHEVCRVCGEHYTVRVQTLAHVERWQPPQGEDEI